MTKSNKYHATGKQKAGGEGTPPNVTKSTQKYEPTAGERAALERLRAADAPVRLKLDYEGNAVPDHPDEQVGWALVLEALGTTDPACARGLLAQLVTASAWVGTVEEDDVNSLFATVASQKPRDAFEAMIMAQMTQVHAATMRMTARLANVEFIRGSHPKHRRRVRSEKLSALSILVRALSQLATTFTQLLRTLNDYRRGSEQSVTIQVSDGGQAIVAKLAQAERRSSSEMAPPLALTHAPAVPMPAVKERSDDKVPLEPKAAKRNGKARP